VDPDTVVFYEPWGTNFNAGMPTAHGDIGAGQTGFSFHVYACPSSLIPFVLPSQVTQVCGPIGEERVYANADGQGEKLGHALLVTEFGASDDLATIDRMADLADAHRVGWQYWAWWNTDPSGERPNEGLIDDPKNPPTTAHLDEAKLDVLVRPFPRAVAGTPSSWSWDEGTRRFAMRYSTRPVDGDLRKKATTDIWIPARHFPGGYQVVELAGARVMSAPDAELLELAANPGAAEVSIAVTPR
jgi:endoglycosylceramidase